MVIDWTQALVSRIVTFVTPVLYRVTGDRFLSKTPFPRAHELSENDVRKWSLVSSSLFFLAWGAIGFPLGLLLKQAYIWYSATFPEPRVYIGPPDIAFVVPSLFGAMGLGVFSVTLFLRCRLKGRFVDYCEAATYDQYKISVSSDRIAMFFVIFLLSAFLFCTTTVFRTKIVFYDNHFLTCGAIDCESRQYFEISEIGKATHLKLSSGDLISRPTVFFRFKDGALWKPTLIQDQSDRHEEVLKLVEEKTGLPIMVEELLPER